MNLPDKFKFEVVGGEYPVYFAEKINDTSYKISWSTKVGKGSVIYQASEVKYHLSDNKWKIIKEEETVTTKLKPFNLEKALAGEKVVTLGGQEVVKIVHFKDATPEERVIFQVEDVVYLCNEEGKYFTTGSGSQLDLFMTTTKKQGWVGVYKPRWPEELARCNEVYATKEEALEKKYGGLIDIVMIEWEE
jgi:hypothetical protein